MPRLNPKFFIDDDFEEYADPLKRRHERSAGQRAPAKVSAEIAEQDDSQERFDFTYQASRHERWWLSNSLGGFYEQQWISDVLAMVRGGKEASVYQCRGTASTGAPYLAAKVYRPRQLRNLRNDSLYREGRANIDADGHEILDGRMQRAMRNRTSYGLALLHTSWLTHEFTTLQALHAAGADVPTPYATGENAILMGYIGDESVAAPTLSSVSLEADEAHSLFERVFSNIAIMLQQERIHGDLSAYNILYWEGRITLIDFPQAISPRTNRNAYRIFERDVARVCEYFTRQGVKSNPRSLARELWTSHGYRLAPEVHPGLLDAADEGDRKYWEQIKA
ncbi:MAG: RIO1 family regulatory kinase/ATPase [Chloroflexota bacterium]